MPNTVDPRPANRGWLLFLLSLVYLYLFVRVSWRVGDEGLVIYGAQRVSEGALPYRDFVEVFGPASFYWIGLFFSLFGTTWVVVRGLLLFTGATTAALIYWMTRRLYRGPLETMPAVFVLMMGIPLWPASSHHWDSILLALLALGSFSLWQDKGGNGYLLLAGALAGLTSCAVQQKGLLLLLALVLSLILGYRHRPGNRKTFLAQGGCLIAGYTAVGGLVVVFFYARGGLPELLYATVFWPLSGYHAVNSVPYGYGAIEFHWPYWQAILRFLMPDAASRAVGGLFLVPFVVLLALPVLLLVPVAMCWRHAPSRRRVFNTTTLPYWCSGIALWISEIHRMDIVHMAFGSPVLLVVLFATWNICLEGRKLLRMGPLAFVTLCLFLFGAFNAVVATSATHRVETRRGSVYTLAEDAALKFLLDHTQPGEQVFVYPYYAMYYFLANLQNPTRYNNLIYGYHTEEQFLEAISDLERKKVKLVLWDTVVQGKNLKTWFPRYEHPAEARLLLERYLQTHYDMVGIENGFRILRRRRE